MANELRNECLIQLAGQEILLRPTFGCLIEIESRTGKSIMELVQRIEGATLSMNDTLVIYEEGTKAAGKPLTRNEIIDLVESEGVVGVQTSTVEFFTKALYPGPKAKKDTKKKEVAKA